MKKIICFVCFVLCFVLLVSCGKKENEKTDESTNDENVISTEKDSSEQNETEEAETPDETEETDETASGNGSGSSSKINTETKEIIPPKPSGSLRPSSAPPELNGYFTYVLFERTDTFRNQVVSAMKRTANIEWVSNRTFKISQSGLTGYSVNYTFEKGKTYYGLPYANKPTTADEFLYLSKNGYTQPGSDSTCGWNAVPGLQCITSINYALQSCINIDANATEYFLPGYNRQDGKNGANGTPDHVFASDHLVLLGGYSVIPYTEKNGDTSTTVKKEGASKMAEYYSRLMPGDIIIKVDPSSHYKHARLISGNTVVFTENGKVNLKKSYVITTEQTNEFDNLSNRKTTWWVDHKYTFADLFVGDYLPLTLKEYEHESEYAEPYLALDKEITPSSLSNNSVNSNVVTNFPLRYVKCELCDTSGNVISDYLDAQSERYSLNVHSLPVNAVAKQVLGKATSGKTYTFKVYGCLAAGEKLICSVSFTK